MTICRLNSVSDFVAKSVPDTWMIGVFGSAASCQDRTGNCATWPAGQDLDLLVIYPDGYARVALQVRRSLTKSLSTMAVVADVVLLSDLEAASSGFWDKEQVRHVGCARA